MSFSSCPEILNSITVILLAGIASFQIHLSKLQLSSFSISVMCLDIIIEGLEGLNRWMIQQGPYSSTHNKCL